MERLGTIEIEVVNDLAEDATWYRKTLVGEEAREWLRDHSALGDDPRVEQDRARELAIVLLAARDNQIDRACKQPDCEGCHVFEQGYAWLLGLLPEKYQRSIAEYVALTQVIDFPTRLRRH